MKPLKVNINGTIARREIIALGGKYSLIDKITLKGTGSPKIIYVGGLPYFDELTRNIENEVGQLNFELLKNGLILHFNINQRKRHIGVKISDIEKIELVAFRIKLKGKNFDRNQYRILHRGELTVTGVDGKQSFFSVIAPNFKGLLRFFEKEELFQKLAYSISTKAPEKEFDNDPLADLLFDALSWLEDE